MVLEHLFPESWLEKKVGFAFLIAVIYSIIGIIAARLLFGANSGIVSVIFTSLLILPYLQKMFRKEEREEEKEQRASLKHFESILLFFKNNQAIRVYFAIFFGIFFTYAFASFILPQLGVNTFNVLKEQLFVDPALRGRAVFSFGTFISILANNWWVLLACFLLAIISGDGAIFFITWNASSWGAIFGYRALTAGLYANVNPWWYLFLVIIITLPHVILEGGAYILSAISGSIISDEIIQEKSDIRSFIFYIICGAGIIVLLRFIYKSLFGIGSLLIFNLITIIIITAMIYVIGRLFQQKRLKKVFLNNYTLFIIAIIVFVIGTLVETLVLNNVSILNKIYIFSHMFG
ncbi:MAG: stage II sporulation protein M [Nanoarchaeota archaeon]|nr:stage II sporulation protein M [Nanoarchaeota archaeon]MBU1322089.1 stage II sporulation protein M [Nanoarchaeota archaeon]MBU1597907.1 stage II sporulation protein M [Nanoarchaeota archaeon]MBU2442067.1 stage II sporulation protein M [Nanoarchaeota archaeon]